MSKNTGSVGCGATWRELGNAGTAVEVGRSMTMATDDLTRRDLSSATARTCSRIEQGLSTVEYIIILILIAIAITA
ncbi:MAG: hypothetical protein R3B99_06340 [Polyangiales bacterium]